MLLDEPPSAGRATGRDNVGHCFCVELCVEQPVTTPVDVIPLFTHVGDYRVDPSFGDFTSDGTTTAGDLAFTDLIALRGLIPNGSNPQALEYRFQVGEYDAPGVVLGSVSAFDTTRIAPTIIGLLEYFEWNSIAAAWVLRYAEFWVNQPAAGPISIAQPSGPPLSVPRNVLVGPGGWIAVPRNNDLSFGGTGSFVGGFSTLAILDTSKLTDESFDLVAPSPALAAGQAVPAAKQSRKHRFKLLFEARVVGGASVSSNDLDKIAITNIHYRQQHHPSWAGFEDNRRAVVLLDIQELTGVGAGCGKLAAHLHALYSAYHPFLGAVTVYFEGNPTLPAPLSPASVGGLVISPPGGHDFVISGLQPCAYILWLQVTVRVTSGSGLRGDATSWDHVAFCIG